MGAFKTFALCLILWVTLSRFVVAVPKWQLGSDGNPFFIEIDQSYNWFQALHECARRDLQLVEVQTGQKNTVLLGALKSYVGKSRNLWLGANDEYNTDRDYYRPFYWSSSGRRMTFAYWSQYQPDNYKNVEHCVHTWASKDNFQWNDAPCTAKMGFVCERKPKPV